MTLMRARQDEEAVAMVKQSLASIQCLFQTINETSKSQVYFAIGQETMRSRVALSSVQKKHRQEWQEKKDEEAVIRVAEHVALNSDINEGAWIIENLRDRGDSIVKSDRVSSGYTYLMRKYAHSHYRCNEFDQDHWYILLDVFVQRCLHVWAENGILFSTNVIRNSLKVSSLLNRISRIGKEDFQATYQTGIHLPSIEEIFFDTSNPVISCRALAVLDSLCIRDNEEGECSPHYVLLCGLAWLRRISAQDGFSLEAAIDSNEDVNGTCLLSGLDCSDWRDFFTSSWPRYEDGKERQLLEKPCLAAYGAATIVEHYAKKLLPRTRCFLRDCCQEALLLSASWHFYLSPSVHGYSHALSLWKPRTMPEEYDPSALLHRVLKADWSAPAKRAEDDAETTSRQHQDEKRMPPMVPLLPQRVELAIMQNSLEQARELCLKTAKHGNVWDAGEYPSELFNLAYGCLLVVKAATKETKILDDELITVTMQALLSVNWLEVCGKSSPSSSQYSKIACRRLPPTEHRHELLTYFDDWDMATSNPTTIDKCINTVNIIGTCLRYWVESGLSDEYSRQCDDCRPSNGRDARICDFRGRRTRICSCFDRANKRQRLIEDTASSSGIMPDAETVLKYLDELVLLSQELQLPEEKFWYEKAKRCAAHMVASG